MKAPYKRGVDAVQYGLLKMSKQYDNVGVDCLAHMFLWVLYDSCRHFRNQLLPEAARARYMDTESVWIPGTRLGHMAEKLACNNPLMNVSVPRQGFGSGATAAAGHQSVVYISKNQGEWQPPAGYTPHVPQKKSEYGHHLFVMSENEVYG